jgi:hypothetical protein
MLSHDFLLRRIETVEQASLDPFLIDRILTDVAHNDRACVLRNGLMVVAFTSLEDFIRARTGELLDAISRTVLPFSDLPETLQNAATMGAMKAARSRAEMAKSAGEDAQALLQEAASHIASTAGGSLQISRYSLAYSGSNVSSAEISGILAAFHVADAWNEITSIASRCGAGSLPLKSAYDQAIQLRHPAAHRPDANVQPRDLQGFCSQAIAIALGFDVIASRAARLIREGDSGILAGKVKLAGTVRIRFLDVETRGTVERREGRVRAVSVNKDPSAALKNAVRNATTDKDPVVSRGPSQLPVNWVITDIT